MRNSSFRSSNSFTFGLVCTSILLFLTSVSWAQDARAKNVQDLVVWQQRVDDLTGAISKDLSSAEGSEKALYNSLIAKILWKSDADAAKSYLKRSSVGLVNSLETEDGVSLERKLQNIEKTIKIISGLDVKTGQSIAEQIAKILEAKGNSGGNASADSFVTLALQVLNTSPIQAFQLGVKSLAYGNSLRINVLILRLNNKEARLGDQLFLLSLASARRNYNYSFIGGLGLIVFEGADGKSFSEIARRSYLETLADFLSNAALNETARERCNVVSLIAPILPKFDEYLLSQSLTVRQQLKICLPFSSGYGAETIKATSDTDTPQTADDFLRLARDTKDPGLKGHYFSKAIAMLAQKKDYDEIISILDDMTETEVKATSFGWDDWRVVYAFEATLISIKNKDFSTAYKIVNKTPKRLRPYVRFRVVYKLSPTDYREFILENLEDIRKELSSLEVSAKESSMNHIALAGLYLKIQPTEAEASFRYAVKYINKTDEENPNFLPEKDYAPLQDYVPLASELLEIDELSIFKSLISISSWRSRVRLRLGLLESSLKNLSVIKKRIELEKKGGPKGQRD